MIRCIFLFKSDGYVAGQGISRC